MDEEFVAHTAADFLIAMLKNPQVNHNDPRLADRATAHARRLIKALLAGPQHHSEIDDSLH